jgi:hypothetical protein
MMDYFHVPRVGEKASPERLILEIEILNNVVRI